MTKRTGVSTLGLDIGGANLKWSVADGPSGSVPFAMWWYPERLPQQLVQLDRATGHAARVAVTMTGELADCFADRRSGVWHIVNACVQVFGKRRVAFYSIAGRLMNASMAKRHWDQVASANWHAAATVVAMRHETGLWIDMGSTTTDVIPFHQGQVQATGKHDLGRMINGELVYTGVARTPVGAVLPGLSWQGRRIPLAAELFATMADAYLLAGWRRPNAAEASCADGRPMTIRCSQQRIARMLCTDAGTLAPELEKAIVEQAIAAQQSLLIAAVRQVLQRNEGIGAGNPDARAPALVFTGSGAAIARRLLLGSEVAVGFSVSDGKEWHWCDAYRNSTTATADSVETTDIASRVSMTTEPAESTSAFCARAVARLANTMWEEI